MRVGNGTGATDGLTFLFGDHLGSTSITYTPSKSQTIVQKYKPWGEIRSTSGKNVLPTDCHFSPYNVPGICGQYVPGVFGQYVPLIFGRDVPPVGELVSSEEILAFGVKHARQEKNYHGHPRIDPAHTGERQ
jgi:hypothetical protein